MYVKHGNLVDAGASGAKASTKHLESRSRSLRSRILGSLKSRRGTATACYCTIMLTLESEISKERSEHLLFENLTVIRCPLCREPPANIRTNLTFLKLESLTYILPLTVWVYLHSRFSGGLRKTIFPQKCVSAIQGHPMLLILVPIENAFFRMRFPVSQPL